MQLNRSTDYAIQMLVYLAKAGKTVSSSKLAAAIGVSHRYLLQISAKLRAAGFIRAAHGPSGGLKLAKAPEEISLYDIILSMEGAVQIGEICGTPIPATTRVVQMEPGPIPTLTASAPASIRALAASPVATFPAIT